MGNSQSEQRSQPFPHVIEHRLGHAGGELCPTRLPVEALHVVGKHDALRGEARGWPHSMRTLTLATWNVMGPISARRQEVILGHIAAINPDVIVLTEAHDTCVMAGMHVHSSAHGRDGHDPPEHRWVTIWSRFPLTPIDVSDDQRTAAARVICGRVDSAWVAMRTFRWPGAATPDKSLTDHFGVGVVLRNAVASNERDPR